MKTKSSNRDAWAFLTAVIVFIAFSLHAQWSVQLTDGKGLKEMFAADDPRQKLPDYLFQPFSSKEWEASNFAAAADVARFQDLRYGMFIHFGVSTYIGKDLSSVTVQSI